MSLDVGALILQPQTVLPLVAAAGATLAATLMVSVAIPPLSRRLIPNPKESRLVDYLPFQQVLSDGYTIRTTRGDHCRVLKIAGAELVVTNERENQALFVARRTWLSQVAERRVRARIFSVRTHINPGECLPHPDPIMGKLAQTWEQSFASNSFTTEHYLILSVEKGAQSLTMLDEATSLSISALDPFGPELLTNATNSESPLKILARLASPITRPSPPVIAGAHVSDQISADAAEFNDDNTGLITFRSGPTTKHCAIVGVKTWGDFSEEKMLADLSMLPFEYIIYHHIEPLPRVKAMTSIDVSNRLAKTNVMRQEAHEQFEAVKTIVEGGAEDSQVLCHYGLNILVEADTPEELSARIGQINTIAAQYEVTTVREGAVAQAIWWSMFPTYDKLPRPWKPLAANVATLLALQRNNKGYNRSPWGEGPVTLLRNSMGNPYQFVFHDMSDPSNKEPLGHMLVVGPSGSGKTVLVSWLSMMAMRYPDLRSFFFDRFNGTEVVTRMAGGQYVTFDGSGSASMNPLQMEMTPRNRDFLVTWFKLITGLTDEVSSEHFGLALDMLQQVPIKERNLKDLWKPGFPAESEARAKLMPWVSENQYGPVFCALRDSLDLDGRLVSFDFTNILNPERLDNLGPAVVSYIMHRTMDVATYQGHPSLYFIDETAPLLKNPFFAAKFAAGLQEGRKLNQVFICAFQRPNAIEESNMAQTILGQCATQIFFRNVKAKEEDFRAFGFTEREMDFVLGRSHRNLKRAFLMRRLSENASANESMIIDADFTALRKSPIGDGLNAFASGSGSVRLIQQLAEQHPHDFRQKYMELSA